MKKIQSALLLLAVLAIPAMATAETAYPSKPIKLLVPWSAGGTTDVVGRILARGLTEAIGQPVVVENKGGANGIVGTKDVVKAAADGYTLLMGSSGALTVGYAVAPRSMGYNPIKDLSPVMLVAKVPLVLVVNPSVPATNFKEFIDLAKSNPGKISMASAGTGSTNHLSAKMFEAATGTTFIHVPYKGTGPAMTDLLGGHVQAYFDQVSTSASQIHSGKLRALAVTSSARSPQLPNVPTMQELGLAGFDVNTFFAVLLPAGAPATVVETLNNGLRKTVHMKDTRDSFKKLGIEVTESSPEEMQKFMKRDLAQWQTVAKKSKIDLD